MGRLVRRVLSRCRMLAHRHHRRPSISGLRCRSPPAVYPGTRRAALAFPVNLAPDEVYPADPITRAAGGLLHHRFTLTPGRSPWRSAFCCTFSRIAPGGCYPPSCPVEPGRSSARTDLFSEAMCDATVLPTHSRFSVSGPQRSQRRTQSRNVLYSPKLARRSIARLARASALELSRRGTHSNRTGVPINAART